MTLIGFFCLILPTKRFLKTSWELHCVLGIGATAVNTTTSPCPLGAEGRIRQQGREISATPTVLEQEQGVVENNHVDGKLQKKWKEDVGGEHSCNLNIEGGQRRFC